MTNIDDPLGLPPSFGQKTKPQSALGTSRRPGLNGGGFMGMPTFIDGARPENTPGHRRLRAGSANGALAGHPPCPEGSYNTYREILTDPTVQIAYAVITGPILSSEWTYEASDNSVPSEIVDFVRSQYDPIAISLKTQLLRAVYFGCRSFQQAYRPIDDPLSGRTLIGIDRFVPLRPELTAVLVDLNTGQFAGLRNGDVELTAEETLHFGYDMEDDDYYGRSRLENVRERAWWPHLCLERRMGQLAQKVSQIIPIVKGPLNAKEAGPGGEEITGYDAGMQVLNALIYGDGVLVENLAAGLDDLSGNPDLSKLSRWDIENYDTGQSATGISGMLDGLRYYDQLKMRGMLRPERTATEGQHGTKAEVAEQADVGLAEGDQLHTLMCQLINWHSVNRLLVWNYGPQFENAVRIVPAPLIDEKKAVFKLIWSALLVNPNALDLLLASMNLDTIAETLGVPTIGDLNVSEANNPVVPVPSTTPPATDPTTGLPFSRAKRLKMAKIIKAAAARRVQKVT